MCATVSGEIGYSYLTASATAAWDISLWRKLHFEIDRRNKIHLLIIKTNDQPTNTLRFQL